jgi:hypothetical protein
LTEELTEGRRGCLDDCIKERQQFWAKRQRVGKRERGMVVIVRIYKKKAPLGLGDKGGKERKRSLLLFRNRDRKLLGAKR